MGLVAKPTIEVSDIEVEIDKGNETGAERIMNTWGTNVPIVQIGDYILNIDQLEDFSLNVRFNSLPTFSMTVDDHNLSVRKILKADIDKCIIFIGFKDWYLKFEGLIKRTYSDAGSANLILEGLLWNEKLYSNLQKCYKEMTMEDVYKELLSEIGLGFFYTDSEYVTKQNDILINPNMRQIDFLKFITEKYSKNLWCIDPLYYFHLGNITDLRSRCDSEDYDKMLLDNQGKTREEAPIILTSNIYPGDSAESDKLSDSEIEENLKKVHVDFYTIDTNFSEMFMKASQQYFLNETEVPSNNEIGIGKFYRNTKPSSDNEQTFEMHTFPFYNEVINKQIGGTVIKTTSKNVILELSPFDIVKFECYLPRSGNEPIKKDEEHSGAKIVIGYGYHYVKEDQNSVMRQSIEMI